MAARYGHLINKWTVVAVVALALMAVVLATALPAVAQTVPPGAPTDLAADAVGTTTIELDWTAPTEGAPFTGYKIERSTDDGKTWVVAAADTDNDDAHYSDMHSSLAGKTVTYRVAGINILETGPVSARANATPPVSGAQPNAPTGLTAMADGSTTINLTWTAPARGAFAITGYTVQWSANGKLPWKDIVAAHTGTDAIYTDTVTAGTTRHYRVAATNGAGRGPFSGSVKAATPPTGVPGQPTGLMAEAVGTTTVELSWTAVPDDAYVDTGYKIERSTDDGKTWVVAAADTGNDDAHYSDMHSSLAGKTVTYRVAGINILGTGPVSARANATPPVSGAQPNAPMGLTAMADGSTTINLTWTAPARGASAISGYTVQWSANGKLPWKDIVAAHTGTVATYTETVEAGTTRHYRVAATNGAGRGPFSGSVKAATPPTGVPGQPTGLMAEAVGTTTVELSWTAVPDDAYVDTGYKIERSTDDGKTWVVVAADTGNDDAHYSDMHSSLAGKTVTYRVAGINIVGTGPVSETANATPPVSGAQPNAPTGLTAEAAGSTTIILTWTAPARGASAINGYTVQYSNDGELPWTAVATAHAGTATIYTATGEDAGTKRHYRVAASNSVGMGPFSAPTTLGPADQEGEVTLSTQEPMVGTAITANLTDADGMVSGQKWQWEKSMDMTSWMPITGATMRSYTPVSMDGGYHLRATVTYTDKYRADRTAYSMATGSMVTSNRPPAFATAAATREVAENTAAGMNVGDPVTATDPDNDTLTYGLGGTDSMYFTIDDMGQIMTKAELDYEMPRGQAMSDTNTNAYMVTVTATDSSMATDTIDVTVMVTDVMVGGDATLNSYDANGNEMIEKSEVIKAINDYLFPQAGVDPISKADVIKLINLYLF